MCLTETSLLTLKTARGVFAVMAKPLSVNQLSAQLFNELLLAALIRDRATTMVITFRYSINWGQYHKAYFNEFVKWAILV